MSYLFAASFTDRSFGFVALRGGIGEVNVDKYNHKCYYEYIGY